MEYSRTDSCVKMWRFSDVSGTDFVTETWPSAREHLTEYCLRKSFNCTHSLLLPSAVTFFQHFLCQLAKLSVLFLHKTSYGQTNCSHASVSFPHNYPHKNIITFNMTGENFTTDAYCNSKTEVINLCLFWLQHHESCRWLPVFQRKILLV